MTPSRTPTGRTSAFSLPRHWYAACFSAELRAARPIGTVVHGVPVVVFRSAGGRASALVDRCPDRNVPLSLGRCHDVTGDTARAEAAYRKAADLAPAYWRPQWALGNLYLRQGRVEEGVEALALVADRNVSVIPLAIQTVRSRSKRRRRFIVTAASPSPP